jgi:hypothetical protein
MTTISDIAVTEIKGSNRIKCKLALVFNKSYQTIENWANKKDPLLTTPDAVRIISEETGLNETEILEESELTKIAS